MLLTNHRIRESHLDLLCHGYCSAELTEELWRTEFSRRLLLFNSVVDLVTAQPELLGPLPAPAGSLALLTEVDDSRREAVRQVLLHPQVGSWAAYVLRRSHGLVRTPAPPWVDVGMLHAVAFVAAVRHGRDWSTVLPARNGKAMLPGLGMAVFPDGEPWGMVEAEHRGGMVTLRCHGGEVRVSADGSRHSGDAGWWELRRLRVGSDPVLSTTLDDIDPFRDLGDPVEPRRLPADELGRWASLLAGAWDIIRTNHRSSAEAMAVGLVSLVPLTNGEGTETRSASTGEAFGSILVSEPDDALSLAVAMIHEFAHSRLGGLLHLLPVTSGGEQEILYAPWRDDPRPLPGLLQGIYAFVNIAAFWRTQARADPSPSASFEYFYARLQVEQALRVVAGSAALTEVGERLVSGLTDRVARWGPGAPTDTSARTARLVAAGHRAGWRIRHLRPAEETVNRLVGAWSDGAEAPMLDPGYRVVPGAKRWSAGRLALARRWAGRRDAAPTDRLRALGVDEADADLLRGEHAAAAAAFTRRILADPDDLDAWSGLGLALDGPAGSALAEHPALVRAVHRGVRGPAADPAALAAWLGRARALAVAPVVPDDLGDRGELR
jgi:HEXXH motif-containing protein